MTVSWRLPRSMTRLVQLYVGLCLYGLSAALQVRGNLGLDPWDVLHQGLAGRFDVGIGTMSIIVGAVVLIGWLPLRQRPGLGTVSNVVLVGASMNASLAVLPAERALLWRVPSMLAGIALCGFATGMYIAADYGPGPRDGLMTGWSARAGISVRLTRTLIEISVLVAGWWLGGTVGIGTVLFALGIGPLAQCSLRLFGHRPSAAVAASPPTASADFPVSRPRRRTGPARWPAVRSRSRTPG